MQLKLNLPVPKTSSAIPYYKELFGGTIIKDGVNEGHAYIKILDKVSLHLHSVGKIVGSKTYHILRFENNERNLYDEVVNKLELMIGVEVNRKNKEMLWGTTLTEFTDRYGYKWVLEIDSK